MYAKWLKKYSTKPCSAKIRNNGNLYSIHLLFDETILVKEAQVPLTGLLCEV